MQVMEGPYGPLRTRDAMDQLLADSRDQAAIHRLQAHGVPALAQLLDGHQTTSNTEAASTLLDALRAVRNLGALGVCVARSLARYRLPELVCGVLSTLVQAGPGALSARTLCVPCFNTRFCKVVIILICSSNLMQVMTSAWLWAQATRLWQ